MTKGELKKFSEAVTTIKSITRVYEQAAARKMKMVKLEIEKIAKYLDAADDTYSSAKFAVFEEEKERIRQVLMSAPVRKPQKDEVLVLIASQTQYFGNLISNLCVEFSKYYSKNRSDSIVLGKIGSELLERLNVRGENIKHFDFDDTTLPWEIVHAVSVELSNYNRIIVFFGEFKSVLTQEAKNTDIGQTIVVKDVATKKKYLFRPEGGNSLTFLENQMISGHFLEKVYESQVAKYAARIKILEIGQVAEKISSAIDQLARGKRNLRKSTNNKKQQQLFTGSDLWEKEGIVG